MTVLSMRAPDVSEVSTVDGRCRTYEDDFGFDITFSPELAAICLKMTATSAVMVPSALGREVVARLDMVPVFSVDRRGHRLWVLLADPPASPGEEERMTLRLFAVGAMPVFSRARIAGDPRRVWLYPPAGRSRPALTELVDAITDAATGNGRTSARPCALLPRL